MERIFHLKENGTTVKTEILAGLTTFMTMAYIIALNPNLLTNFDRGHPAVERRVSGHLHRLRHRHRSCMAFLANKPFVMAPGMGLNSFFAVVAGNVAAMLNTELHQRLPGGAVHHPGGGHRFPAAERVQYPR